MRHLDNITQFVKDDIKKELKTSSKFSIASACFSIYAFEQLKEELADIQEMNFIFSDDAFTELGKDNKIKQFYIPKITRESSLYGTEFEIKLRNEMTQKSIAKECADWIRRKAHFKSNVSGQNLNGFTNIESSDNKCTYTPMNEFTTVELGCERGNNMISLINKFENEEAEGYIKAFNKIWNDEEKLKDVTDEVIKNIESAYAENSPEFVYFLMLYNVFNEFLEDVSEDNLPNAATGYKDSKIWSKLYDFQEDAALAIVNKLEQYNGCILADSVGLGKTFTALAVIKYYENRNKNVLVLCPKKLCDNWMTFKSNYKNNPIAEDRLRYDVLFHTDLTRTTGFSNSIDLSKINWANYDLVVIDESHNFRSGTGTHKSKNKTRYEILMEDVMQKGVKTKVLMLSATPVNNRFSDLHNQLALAYSDEEDDLNNRLNTLKPLSMIFKQAQRAFSIWSKFPPEERTTEKLLGMLDFDFFEVLDSVTIARSRRHIEKYYNSKDIGKFPERLAPISLRPSLTDLNDQINYQEIFNALTSLNLAVYTPSKYIHESKLDKYEELFDSHGYRVTQAGREKGIRKLMRVNLLKRLESSVYAFDITLNKVLERIDYFVDQINKFKKTGSCDLKIHERDLPDLDMEDEENDFLTVAKDVNIDIKDMDYISWKNELVSDRQVLSELVKQVKLVTPEHDSKLQRLFKLIDDKIANPINKDNKKILIFSAFADTADYLFDHVSKYVKDKHRLDSAEVTGSRDGRSTIKELPTDFNTVLTCFSPISKEKQLLYPDNNFNIDILIGTDCISEGQNLQDCDYLVNYDIHWNPVRIIQRFGRIDRIGSKNNQIQLVNFWPDMDLDEYINLKGRVETRMKITSLTATGDEDLINQEEKGDLEYRREQLKRLQEEVVDLEEMSSGISIMDLGLNEFRLDLLEYIKTHDNLDRMPKGLHAIVKSTEECPEGVIFVLRNVNNEVNIDNKNRIHPFYMIYISQDGEVVCDYLNPKQLLDYLRMLCRYNNKPIQDLCDTFNKETKDGKNMSAYSNLLADAISSIIETKDSNDIDSLFETGGTTVDKSKIQGLDDFELICFFVVKDNIND